MNQSLPAKKIDTSLKRREDLTVEELKNLKWFKGKSEEELEGLIEFAKVFTGAVIAIYNNEKDNCSVKKKKTEKLIVSQKSKAA